MHSFIIYSQYLEDYETRFKPKGGRAFIATAPCVYSAVALVWRYLKQENETLYSKYENVEFPIVPEMGRDSYQYEFVHAEAALEQIPEYERESVVRLDWKS
jgi:hypothetical protein